jgi:4-amino-4-deoxy-L-arabinose transferase-like glycosyltransferase
VPWTFERKLLGAAMLAWAVVAVVSLVTGPPLGHDESAFAIVARGATPAWLYRSRGVPVLGELGVLLGGADWQLRLASAIAGLAVVPAVFAAGRAAFDERTGAWAAAVIAGAYPMVSLSAALLGDLPATAGVVAGVAIVAAALGGDGARAPRWGLVLAAPAFAAAFYLRYASAPVIALAGVAALVLWWRPIRRDPWPAAGTAALLVVLLVPHFAQALHRTGALLGILRVSSEVPRRAYLGEGLVTYVTANPFVYYGALVAPALVAAFVGLALAATGRAPRLRRRAPWFLAIIAIGQLVAIGLQSHAQPRYVFIAIALLVVLGVDTLRALARPRLALAAVAVAWLAAAIAVGVINRQIAHHRSAISVAAATLRSHRAHPSCAVIAGTGPQLTWYSGCIAVPPAWDDPKIVDPSLDRFVVSTPYAPLDGPGYAAAHQLRIIELPSGDLRTRVWQIR